MRRSVSLSVVVALLVLPVAFAQAPGTIFIKNGNIIPVVGPSIDKGSLLIRDGKIVDIGKTLTDFNCVDTGVFVCTPRLMDEIEKAYVANGDASLSEGVAALARAGRMHVLDIGDAFWQDVDTPEMLAHAEDLLRRAG